MEVLVLQLLLYVPKYIKKKNRFPNIFVHLPVKIIVIGGKSILKVFSIVLLLEKTRELQIVIGKYIIKTKLNLL